jgi:glutamate/tyrosine decarboxylase-like PLP-dependent enzyme
MVGPAATELERRTVRWLCDLVGFGPEAGGLCTSGGTMANLIGAKLGRDFASGNEAQHEGMRERFVAYVSEERHVSVDKAFDMIGMGRKSLRVLPTDEQFRISLSALESAIAEDKEQGLLPAVLVANAGSTATGAVDPLGELASIARRERMWFHVDAAYGGGVLLSSRRATLLRGIEFADSVTLDPHKWLFAPLDVGALLVRDEKSLSSSFGMVPPYLASPSDQFQYFAHGLEGSRRFRALKVWMGFKHYGAEQLGRCVDQNIDQAELIYGLARRDEAFECLNRPVMSAVCLRYRGKDLAFHQRVVAGIVQEGKYWISSTVLKGQPAFRINPVNFRTQPEHVRGLFEDLQRACRRLSQRAS